MLSPVKVFDFVCVFMCESNRNTLQICMAHKICHSFIPLKKYFRCFPSDQHSMYKSGKVVLYKDCWKEVDNQLNIDLCLGNCSKLGYKIEFT